MADAATTETLLETPLAGLHKELGARMVPFAGYSMPVQYPTGILAEHKQTREAAGLFDVSHMGQAVLTGPDDETVARAVEALTPGDILGLKPGSIRYTLLMTEEGGIVDDLMVTRPLGKPGTLLLVVNAARKAVDYDYIRERLPAGVKLTPLEDKALLALQGPQAAAVIGRHAPFAPALGFMNSIATIFDTCPAQISRSGYTGEDGFEISVPADKADGVARTLLAEPEVKPIGLGARDSLRLEAGLCLYGHDIDETTSPVEADLGFAIGKRRRAEGGFPGADRVMQELVEGPKRLRVGIRPEGKAPAREGTAISDTDSGVVGIVTSGGFGATFGGPVAMGYVHPRVSAPGSRLNLKVRDRELPAIVAPMPFVAHRYFRKPQPEPGKP
jgi:aminomethyltransferase